MSLNEISIALPIAILYPYFFSNLVKKYTKKCGDEYTSWGGPVRYDTDLTEKEKKEKEECKKNYDTTQFIVMLSVGLIAIVLGFIFKINSTKIGMGMAGIFSIFSAILSYWKHIDQDMKLFGSGTSLVLLLFSPKILQAYFNK